MKKIKFIAVLLALVVWLVACSEHVNDSVINVAHQEWTAEPNESFEDFLLIATTGIIRNTTTPISRRFNDVGFFTLGHPLNLEKMTKFYVPNVRIEGYELASVTIEPGRIRYVYRSSQRYEHDITIRIRRIECTATPLPHWTLEELKSYLANTFQTNAEIRGNFLYIPRWNAVQAKLNNISFDVAFGTPADHNITDFDTLRNIAQQVKDTAVLVTVDYENRTIVQTEAFKNLISTPTIQTALNILRYLVDLPSEATIPTHDFNQNGELDIDDALQVLRYLVDLPSALD
ncbi:MAG: hypothetical protein FWF76_00465 [Oscillospiraceae bacterium]|nr:hypothetical protein [Oscillospiraceae bacterium]